MELHKLSINQLAAQIADKTLSKAEVHDYFNKRINKINAMLNIFLHWDEYPPQNLNDGVLHGIPFSMKDAHMTPNFISTAGSRILKDYRPNFAADAYSRLTKMGAYCIGKTNCDAWGHGSSTENSDFNPTRNPVNQDYVPGGSSGGSVAAVAAGLTMFDIGEDTGGSIRQPAAFCGVVGLKVTYGLVSRFGTAAYASSLDTVGPIARTVEDCATILQILAGPSAADAHTVNYKAQNYSKNLRKSLKNIKVGLPREYLGQGIEAGIKNRIQQVAKLLSNEGADVIEVSLPHTEYAISSYYLIATSETSSNLARYDGVRYGNKRTNFGNEAKRRIILGTYTLSAGFYDAYYKKATQVRTLVQQDFAKAFDKVDVLLAPTSPVLPFKLGSKNQDPLEMYLADALTVPINLAGVPAITVPCGTDEATNLPIGLQLIGPRFSEAKLLNVAWHLEQNLN